MADDIYTVKFFQPVYKSQTAGADPTLAEATDVIVVQLRGLNASDEHPTQNLTIKTISDDGTTITYEYDSTNQYVLPERIVSVTPEFQYECPTEVNLAFEGTTIVGAITAFVIDGVSYTVAYNVTADDAPLLEADIQAQLDALGIAGEVTVTYVDAGTDYFKVYVNGIMSNHTISVDAIDLVEV